MTLSIVERVVALQRVSFLSAVPGRVLAAAAGAATEVDVPAGAMVIVQGAVEDHLFVVVTGRLEVRDGQRVLRELGPGSTVGELAALVPEPRSASVSALEPCRLLRIDRGVLLELLEDQPELAQGVIAALVRLIRTAGPA